MLLIDIPMPKDCPMCPCSHYNKLDEFTGCDIVPGKRYAVTEDSKYANTSERPEWCPMKEVQE